MANVKPHKFDGVFRIDGKLATINLVPGERVYGEELIIIDDVEYRIWDKWRSKPAAAIAKGLKTFPTRRGMKILYLGLATSTTASHFSDIIGPEGLICGIEISKRVLRESIRVAEKRQNIIPILADGRIVEDYENAVLDKMDMVYEDVASPDQIPIMIRNAKKFLKPKAWAVIAIKSQSIDVTKDPKLIYKECLEELERHFEIVEKVELDPYEKFHLFVVMRMKS